MTEQERAIIDLARRVRECQRAFYANRSSDRLNTAKKLEKQLDDLLDAYDNGRESVAQPALFGRGAEGWAG